MPGAACGCALPAVPPPCSEPIPGRFRNVCPVTTGKHRLRPGLAWKTRWDAALVVRTRQPRLKPYPAHNGHQHDDAGDNKGQKGPGRHDYLRPCRCPTWRYPNGGTPFGRGRVHRAGGDDPARPRQSHDPVSVARTSRRPDHASPSPPPITRTRSQLRAGKRLPHGHAARAFLTGVHADRRDPSHLVMARPGWADLEIVGALITGASRPAAPKPCAGSI